MIPRGIVNELGMTAVIVVFGFVISPWLALGLSFANTLAWRWLESGWAKSVRELSEYIASGIEAGTGETGEARLDREATKARPAPPGRPNNPSTTPQGE